MNDNFEKKYFEKIYKDYTTSLSVKLNYAFLRHSILKLKNNSKLLELGCAYGYFLKSMENNFQTFGIDISKYAIEQGKKISPASKFFQADIEKENLIELLPKMDVIVAYNLLEHLNDPEKIIKEASEILNKGGYFFIRVPNPSCIYFNILRLFGMEKKWVCYKDKTHKEKAMLTPPRKWKQILQKYNFKCKIIGYPPTNHIKKFLYNLNLFPTFKPLYLLNHSVVFQCKKI